MPPSILPILIFTTRWRQNANIGYLNKTSGTQTLFYNRTVRVLQDSSQPTWWRRSRLLIMSPGNILFLTTHTIPQRVICHKPQWNLEQLLRPGSTFFLFILQSEQTRFKKRRIHLNKQMAEDTETCLYKSRKKNSSLRFATFATYFW